MRTRINVVDRASILRKYRGKVEDLMSDLADLIETNFAPYDSRNYKKSYNPNVEALEYDDIDTPFMKKLLEILKGVEGRLRARLNEVDREEDAYYEGMEMFRAWGLGLCPYVMRKFRREEEGYIGGVWNSNHWDEIVEYLDGKGSKREQTLRAVEAWQRVQALKLAM